MASYLKQAREWATPTLKKSAFLTRGVLTPEEFVRAGDELVFKCPTWSWEGGDPKWAKAYLPPDKQYLVTRNVPCQTRASALEGGVGMEDDAAHIDDECGGDDWLVSRVVSAEEQAQRREKELEDTFDMLDDDAAGEMGEGAPTAGNVDEKEMNEGVSKMAIGDSSGGGGGEGDDNDDEYADMADFEDDNVVEDEAAAAAPPATSTTPATGAATAADDNLMRVRTYDLSITYDKYYQTPRVWMMGYDAGDSSKPLTGEEMMQDVMSDYANRTVTIESHPHVPGPHASVHPCQHGAVMKTIVGNLIRAAEEKAAETEGTEAKPPSVEMYLFIFLKFVNSMIPTINYDFTMDVTASTQK
eukprot:CAMPEP_0197467100 /NCGR_PEP_ID=MMETSP1175-20131217/65394_1 /TAXON_ID=1003142 /ORGANISM="Triceratium dubium, Strain CCMP147" /LENGTH=356 /DNA_ID=CAMNT_0043003161 /DNA_START=21 /DNA_END=1091 /DNA_ORIENTATION=+